MNQPFDPTLREDPNKCPRFGQILPYFGQNFALNLARKVAKIGQKVANFVPNGRIIKRQFFCPILTTPRRVWGAVLGGGFGLPPRGVAPRGARPGPPTGIQGGFGGSKTTQNPSILKVFDHAKSDRKRVGGAPPVPIAFLVWRSEKHIFGSKGLPHSLPFETIEISGFGARFDTSKTSSGGSYLTPHRGYQTWYPRGVGRRARAGGAQRTRAPLIAQ